MHKSMHYSPTNGQTRGAERLQETTLLLSSTSTLPTTANQTS